MSGFVIAATMVLASSFVDLENRELTYAGTADVSAVVFLDQAHFVAADDESNTLRVYRVSDTDKPFYKLELSGFLGADADHPEGDIEAAARVGDTIYWITSHGRNKDGKLRPSRYRFFATEIRYAGGPENKVFSSLAVKGLPCSTLIDQFLKHPAAAGLNLESAVQKDRDLSKKQRKKLAPKDEGLNIEAMTWLTESESLLIGLRNPLYRADKKGRGQAILFELLNSNEVVEGKAAQFGRVLLWDLGDRGLRGMEYDPFRKVHYVIGGAVDSETAQCCLSGMGLWIISRGRFLSGLNRRVRLRRKELRCIRMGRRYGFSAMTARLRFRSHPRANVWTANCSNREIVPISF